jgi:hypothetical protein
LWFIIKLYISFFLYICIIFTKKSYTNVNEYIFSCHLSQFDSIFEMKSYKIYKEIVGFVDFLTTGIITNVFFLLLFRTLFRLFLCRFEFALLFSLLLLLLSSPWLWLLPNIALKTLETVTILNFLWWLRDEWLLSDWDLEILCVWCNSHSNACDTSQLLSAADIY